MLFIFCVFSFFGKAQNVSVTASHATINGSYVTLKAAFDAINAGTHQGAIVINIINNTTETATAKLNAYDGLPAVFTSIIIQPSGGAAKSITGNLATPLIDFNSSDYVTIDGLNSSGNSLTISNTNTSATATTIRFREDATNNIVKNCTILGSSTGVATGTIIFGTSTGFVGNDYNNINNNNIGDAGNNFPYNSIYSTPNTAALSNDNIIISTNNIYNYYSPSTGSNGIYLESTTANVGSSIWTIANNNFYQTGARNNATAAIVSRAVRIGNSTAAISGSGYTITGNIIGYAASNASGVTNYGPGGTNQDYAFIGIDLAVGTGIISTVQNNTIAGIAINSTYNGVNAIFAGINVQTGLVNIGNVTGNKIGLLAAGISITTSGAQAKSFGIMSNQNAGTAAISNNAIINCAATSSTAANANIKFSAIAARGTSGYTIAANTIGRAINITEYLFYAIDATLATTILSSIQGNTVEGVNINSTYNGATPLFAGIFVSTGLVNIGNSTANTIGTLTNSIYISTSGASSISYGIYAAETTGSPVINNNVIQNCTAISSTAGTATKKFSGIYFAGTAGFTVNGNTIGRAITATEYLCYGIEASVGSSVTSKVQSNTVAGITVTNSYSGTIAAFAGIYVAAGLVNIGGTIAEGNQIGTSSNSIFITTSGTFSNSYAIYSNQSTGSSAGISNNNIVNCTIYSTIAANATTKFAGIYVTGTSAYAIGNNNINAAISTSEYLFYGIEANLGTAVTSNINANTIAGITMTSTYSGTTALFAGIYVRAGIVNIGDGQGNKIGTSSNSIFLTTTGANSLSYGIFSDQTALAPTINKNEIQNILLQSNVAASTGIKFSGIYLTGGSGNFVSTNFISNRINATNYVVNGIELNMGSTIPNYIDGNTIAGIDITTNLSGTVGTEASAFVGINVVNGNAYIGTGGGNFIGTAADYIKINTSGNRVHNYGIKIGITVASITIVNNSLVNITHTSTASATADWMNVFTGIYTNNTGAYNITDNNVGLNILNGGITLGTTNTAIPFVFKGIVIEGAYAVTIARNTICNVSNASSFNGVGAAAQTIGIFVNTPTANVYSHTIEKNKIYYLRATNSNSVNVHLSGIVTSNTASVGNINTNTIYGFTNHANGTTNAMNGIVPNGGNWTVHNNMISLSNEGFTNAVAINGIYDLGAAGNRNYWFNSIHIEGTSTGTHNSVAFQFDRVTGTVNSRNNIFDMRRTGAGKNYAIVNSTGIFTSYVSDYNVINAPNATAVCYTNSDKTFAAWKTTSANDAKSIYDEPVPFVNQSIADLHIIGKPCKLIGQGIAISITTDFDSDIRKTGVRPFGPEIGADEVGKNITWTGIVNSNWNNIGNWGGSPVPNTVTDNVIIPNVANKPVINVGETFQVSSISIATGSSLVNNGTLKVFQSIFATNSLNTQNGNIEFNGQCTFQNIAGSMFTAKSIKSLIISNASGVNPSVLISNVLNDTLKITENLSFGNTNNAFLQTSDNLTLVSNAAATANLADITNGGVNTGNAVNGKVNVERYMFARSSWRLLATPIEIATSPTVSQAWRENNAAHTATGYGTRITGPIGPFGAAGTLDDYSVRPSMKSYNSTINDYTGVVNANTTPIANKNGYYVFVRGDRSAAPVLGLSGISTLRMKGNLRQGDQVFNVIAGKFESIGNPFASRIDMRKVNKVNVVDAFYVWNPNNTGLYNVGGYEAYSFNASTGNYERVGDGVVRNYIESGEAFFVQSNVASPAGTITIGESDKGNGSANVSRPGVTTPTLEINMYAQNTNGTSYLADGVKINYNNSFSAGVDNLDVRKINNTYDNLAIKNGVSNLIVERRPHIVDADTIKLNITGMRIAPYRIEIDPSVLTNTSLEGTFVDKFTNVRTPMSFTDVTTISFEITADAASRAADRFIIVFKAAPSVVFKNIAAVRNTDKTVAVKWNVDNEVNVESYTVEYSTDGINFNAIATETTITNNGGVANYGKINNNASLQKNWYRIKANNTFGAPTYSAIALVNDVVKTNTKTFITLETNLIFNGQVKVIFSNQVKGKYSLVITNTLGQIIKQSQVYGDNEIFTYNIKTENIAKGNYQLTVINTTGEKITMPFIVK